MDKVGNMAIGYSLAGPEYFGSIVIGGRLKNDPLNTLSQGATIVRSGVAAQTANNRWGDYATMNIDPVSSQCG